MITTYGAAFLAGQSNALFYSTISENLKFAITYTPLTGFTPFQTVAVGSTGLNSHQAPATSHWKKGQELYNQLRDGIIAQADKQHILVWWIQGEQDCLSLPEALVYGADMIQLATDLEQDTGRELHWIDCQLHSGLVYGTAEARAAVRAGKNAFAQHQARCIQINPEGLALSADNIHWAHATKIAMADRMWSAARQLGLL